MYSDEIPMSIEHCRLLIENCCHLIEFIEPAQLLTVMYSVGAFTNRDLQRIRSKGSVDDMNEALLSFILRKPDSVFRKFIVALQRTDQGHVLNNWYGKCTQSICRHHIQR